MERRFQDAEPQGDQSDESGDDPVPDQRDGFPPGAVHPEQERDAEGHQQRGPASQCERQVSREPQGDEVECRVGEDEHPPLDRPVDDGAVGAVDSILDHIEVGVDPVSGGHQQHDHPHAL